MTAPKFTTSNDYKDKFAGNVTAPSRQDETWNGDQNARQNPEMVQVDIHFQMSPWKETCDDHLGSWWHDSFMWQDSFMWHMTHSCDSTHSYMWHDSFMSHMKRPVMMQDEILNDQHRSLFKSSFEKKHQLGPFQDFILHSDRPFRVSSFWEWAVACFYIYYTRWL